MLPRISAALSTLVSPISSAKSSQSQDFERAKIPKHESSERRHKDGSPEDKPKLASVVPLRSEPVAPDRSMVTPTPPLQSLSVAHSLVHLIGMLKGQTRQLSQWVAMQAYRKVAKGSKKMQVRKGAMLDRQSS